MSSRSYSFLDVAVLETVGTRFAAGDALVMLSEPLDQVLWANGQGARLFGFTDILSFLEADPELPLAVRRQIEATPGYPRIGRDRPIVLRLASGLSSRATAFAASSITMPDGEEAILLAAPDAVAAARAREEIAARAIEGLSGEGQFVALVDGSGALAAASAGFAELGIAAETLKDLAGRVANESDRLVKQLVPAAKGALPAGMARLAENPTLNLLMIIDEAIDGAIDEHSDAAENGAAPEPGAPVGSEVAEIIAGEAAQEIPPAGIAADEPERVPSAAGPASSPDADIAVDTPSSDDQATPKDTRSPEDDQWYFSGSAAGRPVEHTGGHPAGHTPGEASAEEAVLPRQAEVEIASMPVRFVWRTDAEGCFSALSDEFHAAFGEEAADVIGRRFTDVASVFGLDPDGAIAGLLERRDTWSGRSVLWPVAGTDLKVPVDLAALPVYGRDRSFEGFRGFGVARMGDAVVDPEAIGLALRSPAPVRAHEPAEAAPTDTVVVDAAPAEPVAENVQAEDPFRGETPALEVGPGPDRRLSDKVIQLAERRPNGTRALSAAERLNFNQIGEKLRSSGLAVTDETAAEAEPPIEPEHHGVHPQANGHDASVVGLEAEDENRPTPGPEAAQAPQTGAEATSDRPSPIEEPDIATVPEEWPADSDSVPPVASTEPQNIEPSEPAATEDVQAPSFEAEAPEGEAAAEEASAEQAIAADEAARQSEADRDEAAGSPAAEPVEAPSTAPVDSEAPPAVADGEAEPAGAPIEVVPSANGADIAPETGEAAPETAAGLSSDENRTSDEQRVSDEKPASPRAPHSADTFLPSAFAGFSANRNLPGIDAAVLSRLPLPLLIHGGDALFYANREFLQLTGYSSLAELELAGGLGAIFGDPYASDETAERKLRLRTGGDEEFPVDAFLQSVAWNGGKALLLALKRTPADGAEAIAAPQPAAALAEPDLEARLEELRTIIDTATDGVVIIDNDGTIRSISRPAEALFGFDNADVAGRHFVTLFAIESQKAASDYLAGLAGNGVASVLNDGREVIGREAQGRFIPLFMTIGRLPHDSGFCAVVRDITQWKRAEEELTQARAQAERASSQKTEFLARVSHEIRTPLNAIIGFSELMVDEKFGPITNDRYRDYLRDINKSGNHVLDLVNDLLDISKIEAGQQEMSYEAVSLNETLGEAVAMMQPQANRERVIIRSSFASRLPEVVADLRSVRQITLNLLSNAIRYTPAGGQVIVSTAYEPSGDIVMRVRDTGIGMAAAEIEQALKPFKQINALKRPRGDGTGLGLPLTKAMVEANRARFTIHSAPGEGTLVEITFPSTRVLAH